MSDRICKVEGCGRTGKLTRGMCGKHYRYWIDHTPHDQRAPAPRLGRSFWDFVDKTQGRTACWSWTGPRNRSGYGAWSRELAHRAAYRLTHGAVPDGLYVCHRCDNPPCVNPAHLYAGTPKDNVHDMFARGRSAVVPRKSHCIRGHELTGGNAVERKDGGRSCRTCTYARARASGKAARRVANPNLRQLVSDGEKQEIYTLRMAGASHRNIAKRVGRALQTVQRVLKEAEL